MSTVQIKRIALLQCYPIVDRFWRFLQNLRVERALSFANNAYAAPVVVNEIRCERSLGCRALKITKWFKQPLRIEPIMRSTYGFCHGSEAVSTYDSRHGKEIDGHHLAEMVVKKGLPRLASQHSGDGAFADRDAEHLQFAMNRLCRPQRIGCRHRSISRQISAAVTGRPRWRAQNRRTRSRCQRATPSRPVAYVPTERRELQPESGILNRHGLMTAQ